MPLGLYSLAPPPPQIADGANMYSSWWKVDGGQVWSLPVRVVLNGLLDDVPPPPTEAANFSYYTHQLLGKE